MLKKKHFYECDYVNFESLTGLDYAPWLLTVLVPFPLLQHKNQF